MGETEAKWDIREGGRSKKNVTTVGGSGSLANGETVQVCLYVLGLYM